jgi:hypothetical protein
MKAILSDDRTYRYVLSRALEGGRGILVFVMLNPSTADEESDDPTIRRCVEFARRWDYTELRVVNLYAYRTAYPAKLWETMPTKRDGPENASWQLRMLAVSDLVVCAWGAAVGRDPVIVREFLGRARQAGKVLWHLGLTKAGHPRHPLYVAGHTALERYEPAGV